MDEALKPLTDAEYKNSKELYAIDLMKLFMALSVVGIHTDPLKTYSSFINSFLMFGIFRLSVPFFFVSSSWLLFRKIDLNNIRAENIRKYICRLTVMYVLWTLIYIPAIIDEYTSFAALLKNVFLLGSYNQLWYLLASIYAVILIYLLLRIKFKKVIFVLAALCFIAGLSVSGYYELLSGGARVAADAYLDRFISARNGLLFAFPYMAVGVLLAKNKRQYGKKQVLCVLGLLYILHLTEMFIIRKFDLCYTTDLTLITLPLTAVLVYTLIHINLKKRKIYSFLRNSSIIVYLIHPYIIKLYDAVISLDNSLVRYIFVCTVSLLAAKIILSLEKYKYFAFLKYLH